MHHSSRPALMVKRASFQTGARWALWLILVFALAAPAQAGVQAAPQRSWQELRTRYFAIIFPTEYEQLAQLMIAGYGQALDSEYERFSRVFAYELQPPVSLRVYPTIRDFQELNPLTPSVLRTATHSHIGYREIALIGENILADPGWSGVAINHIRYELAILFAQKITDLKAPPGLLAGIGRYAQDPELGAELDQGVQAAAGPLPQTAWLETLNNPEAFADPGAQLESAALVSFLVQRASWPTFVDFLKALSTSGSAEQAAASVYGLSAGEVQALWSAGYAAYLASGWQASIFYSYDLGPLEELLRAGGYSAAEQQLAALKDLLDATGQADNAARAAALLETARKGLQAGEKALQARQALLDGGYERVALLCQQAEALYAEIGDARRSAELLVYQQRAADILALRAELDGLASRALLALDPFKDIPRLARIGRDLGALGDEAGSARAADLIRRLNGVQEGRRIFLNLGALLFVLLLLGLRIRMAFQPAPLEVKIQ